ncbi:uncharacterized protein LOC62_01G001204 [Vanrija pseudolonga]|uniref:Uncharacterized protein n=1 Tax=Vanrija pseudolonga TaxID=143232 RepID=A0AAF0Y0L3_9TREE|nr:hypothetical protein LOC62_01G001204 [Vanrija pseudolonga]
MPPSSATLRLNRSIGPSEPLLPAFTPRPAHNNNNPLTRNKMSSARLNLNPQRLRFLLRASVLANVILLVLLIRWPDFESSGDSVFDLTGTRQKENARVGSGGGDEATRFVTKTVKVQGAAATSTVVEFKDRIVEADTCSMCAVAPELCRELGEDGLRRAVGYMGTNNRLRRALARLRKGQPFNMGVAGGSVSLGHGLHVANEERGPENMHRQIFDYLNKKFPGKGEPAIEPDTSLKAEGRNGFFNGAQGGVGGDYFSMCFKEHFPADTDFLFVETAVNEENELFVQRPFELMLRGFLDLRSEPAVINLQGIAFSFPQLVTGGNFQQPGIAQFYDVPSLSLNNALMLNILDKPSLLTEYFATGDAGGATTVNGIDHRHIGLKGHQLFAEIVKAYFELQLCEMDRIEEEAGHDDIEKLYPLGHLPRLLATEKYDPTRVTPRIDPFCKSMNSKKNKLVPVANEGWREWNWKDKHYLIADKPGSKVTFEIETALGVVQLFFQRSGAYHLGNAKCWVDDDVDKAQVLISWWDLPFNIGRSVDLRTDLAPGKHKVHCELLSETGDPDGGHEFRIISLMSI